jgi:hypothetical protein
MLAPILPRPIIPICISRLLHFYSWTPPTASRVHSINLFIYAVPRLTVRLYRMSALVDSRAYLSSFFCSKVQPDGNEPAITARGTRA